MIAGLEGHRAARARGEPLHAAHVLSAGHALAHIYASIFGSSSLLAAVLYRITSRHVRLFAKCAGEAPGGASVGALLAWETAARGREALRRDRYSGAHALLWIWRVLSFMHEYLVLQCADGAVLPPPAARAAYDRILAPYHGATVARISRFALWYVPADRVKLYKSFGYTDGSGRPEEATGLPSGAGFSEVDGAVVCDMRRCAALLKPLLDDVADALAREGLLFDDRSTSVLE
jgi:hypothetical protein